MELKQKTNFLCTQKICSQKKKEQPCDNYYIIKANYGFAQKLENIDRKPIKTEVNTDFYQMIKKIKDSRNHYKFLPYKLFQKKMMHTLTE